MAGVFERPGGGCQRCVPPALGIGSEKVLCAPRERQNPKAVSLALVLLGEKYISGGTEPAIAVADE